MSVTIPEERDADQDTAFERWINDVRMTLPNVLEAVVRSELITTIEEFYRRAQPWLQELGPYPVNIDQREMKVNPVPDGDQFVPEGMDPVDVQRVIYIKRAWFKGRQLSQAPFGGRSMERTGDSPVAFYCPYPDVIRFLPIPEKQHDDSLTILAAIAPKNPQFFMPQMTWTHFYDVVLDGVLGRMMGHEAKPYANSEKSEFRLRRFKGNCQRIRGEAEAGFTVAGVGWSFPRFGK